MSSVHQQQYGREYWHVWRRSSRMRSHSKTVEKAKLRNELVQQWAWTRTRGFTFEVYLFAYRGLYEFMRSMSLSSILWRTAWCVLTTMRSFISGSKSQLWDEFLLSSISKKIVCLLGSVSLILGMGVLVERKSIKTNPRYFFSGRFFKKGKVRCLLFLQLRSLIKG
jgi:hypothetical protein